MLKKIFTLSLTLLLFVCAASARAHHVEIKSRVDVLNGKSFGEAGAYEKITGKIFFAVDVKNTHNKQIVDLDKADRDTQGDVMFSADFFILRPKDVAKSNGAMLLEIPNRGGKGMVGIMQRGRGSLDAGAEEAYGDGFLMEQGFTLAWIGWQWDVPPTETVLRLFAPIAYGPDHSHITGLV